MGNPIWPQLTIFARSRNRIVTKITYSAAYVRLCIKRISTSLTLLTRNALWPDGIIWRVFLFEPNPIYTDGSQHIEVHQAELAPERHLGRMSTKVETSTGQKHTDGKTWFPLNRRRTRLSIPLGFLQAESRHLNRSLWCRVKCFVPTVPSC